MMDFVDKNDCGASESKWDGDLIRKGLPITDTNTLLQSLDNVFALGGDWPEKKSKLLRILQLVDLSTTEVNKYTFFDVEKPYTRNLIGTDNINYTLLLLCWNPGRESKIHNHPCDGCFIKTLAGCIKETRYEVTTSTSSIHRTATRFYCEGQVSFMDDYIGLHKIGNPSNSTGAITLHLYTPPFSVCKVWMTCGEGQLPNHEEGKVGYFSVYGHRSPHLEGKPGLHAKLMDQIRQPYCGVDGSGI